MYFSVLFYLIKLLIFSFTGFFFISLFLVFHDHNRHPFHKRFPVCSAYFSPTSTVIIRSLKQNIHRIHREASLNEKIIRIILFVIASCLNVKIEATAWEKIISLQSLFLPLFSPHKDIKKVIASSHSSCTLIIILTFVGRNKI